MSDHIPLHIQDEIVKRLPFKSLVQIRSVSKAWKSSVDSSDCFRRHTQPHHVLVSYESPLSDEDYAYFSHCYIDDDTFHQEMSVPTLPPSFKYLLRPLIVGSSHGVLCFFGCDYTMSTQMAILWNPSIQKSIYVIVPGQPSYRACPLDESFRGYPDEPYVGFGVSPVTNDPKIVVITKSSEVMVYTLSSGKWRSLPTINLPANRTRGIFTSVVTTDRFIYWDVQLPDRKIILEFDLTTESLDMIHLPDNLASRDHWVVRISKLRDSLAIIHYGDNYNFSTVWIMEYGAQKSFKQLFTTTTPRYFIVGLRKNGIPIMIGEDKDDFNLNKVVVYEPNSEHTNVLEIAGVPYHFSLHSYMETQLLLGQSD